MIIFVLIYRWEKPAYWVSLYYLITITMRLHNIEFQEEKLKWYEAFKTSQECIARLNRNIRTEAADCLSTAHTGFTILLSW